MRLSRFQSALDLDGSLFCRYYNNPGWEKDPMVRDADIVKRIVDVMFAWSLMVLLAPIFLIISIVVLVTSGHPVIFKQTRVTEGRRPFPFYKFRTMRNGDNTQIHIEHFREWEEKESLTDAKEKKLRDDPRITPLGRWLRRLSIDELPQFYNVLRGELSVVGPRPPIIYELDYYKPWHFKRLEAKPGITGLWQVSGRTRLSFQDMVRLDIEYIKRRSFALDLVIMMKTLPAILRREGAA